MLKFIKEHFDKFAYTVEPLLRGHPDDSPPSLERPLGNVNLNINVFISTPGERPPLLKGHFSGEKKGGLTRGVPLYSTIFSNLLANGASGEQY